MAEQYLRCPNCGANATNHQNCEFCGSLLVRFVEKGIDLSKTTYMSNAQVYPGLIDHLRYNLQLQRQNPGAVVTSGLGSRVDSGIDLFVGNSTPDGPPIPFTDDITPHLYVAIYFNLDYHHAEGVLPEDEKLNQESTKLLETFKSLDSYPLFTLKEVPNGSADGSLDWTTFWYTIDYGQDVEGAARLTSELLQKVYSIPLSEGLYMEIYEGPDNQAPSTQSNNNDSGCFGVLALGVVGTTLLSLLF
jgi:hypothetical protein